MSEWYYARNNQRLGPVTMEQLKQLAASGQLSQGDLVWKDGMANWAPAGTIAGIFAAAAPAPAAPRPAAVTAPPPGIAPDDVVPLSLGAGGPSIVDTAMLIATRAVSPDLDTLKVSEAEKSELTKAGVTGESAERYLVWRRSVLWLAVVPLVIGTFALAIEAMVNNFKPLNGFGILVELFRALTMLALPAFAAVGALFWAKPRLSQIMVTLGVLVCFALPLLIQILPHSWLAESVSIGTHSIDVNLPDTIHFSLLIIALSLAAGAVRACLRVRFLLPESSAPAFLLLGAAPLGALVFYSSLLPSRLGLMANLFGLCLVLAPACYVVGAKTYLRPITEPVDRKKAVLWQWIAFALCGGAALLGVIQIIYIVSKLDSGSFYVIWIAFSFFLDFLGRSLFVTVFAAHLALWVIQTAKSDPAAEKRLSELEPVIAKM